MMKRQKLTQTQIAILTLMQDKLIIDFAQIQKAGGNSATVGMFTRRGFATKEFESWSITEAGKTALKRGYFDK